MTQAKEEGGRKTHWAVIGLPALGLLILPFILELAISPYYLYLFIKILVWALFATSFNLVLGYGGMMSFGHAAFFGVGAYACAILLVKASWPLLPAFVLAPFVAAFAGLVIGFLSVRIRGVFYFATITLSFAQLVYILVFKWRELTFGDDGIQAIPLPSWLATDQTFIPYYFFSLLMVLFCLYGLWRIVRSPFGMVLRSLRENPERAAFLGVRGERYRLLAFVISAFFSGIAGVLFALLETSIAPNILFWSMSGEVILMGLLGGMHLFWGPALGAAIMVALNSFMTSYTQYWGFFLGAVLILMVLFFPKGIGGLLVEQYQNRQRRRGI